MKTEKDYEELLKLFNKHKVKYCIVGAFALGFYALPRYTKDMDVLVEPSTENGRRIVKALNEFGFKSLKLKKDDFKDRGRIIQLGYEPLRVDILTSISGVSFKPVWENRVSGRYGRVKAWFIGREELIRSKRAARRKQDEVDLELLLLAKKRKSGKA